MRYNQTVKKYLNKQFSEAISDLHTYETDDVFKRFAPSAAMLLGLCEECMRKSPGPDWDGVWHSATK